MRHSNEFMNKSRLDFIEIGSYDEEELAKLGSLPFRNVSVELDALQCLRFFPCVENLILRPGEISEEGLGYLRGLRIISLKLDYYNSGAITGHTYSGTLARVGAIAVDPTVIPLGTKMYVVSNDGQYVYGYCVAEDIGGGIKGNKIDLYFDTYAECWDFGVRMCTVYILG